MMFDSTHRGAAFRRLFLLLAASVTASVVYAEELALEASKDASIYESETGNRASGVGQRLFAGETNNGALRRVLLAFDFADVPIGAKIESVALQMRADKDSRSNPPAEFSLHRVTSDWNEGPSTTSNNGGRGSPTEDGDVTWIHTASPDALWNTPGGDFIEEASSSVQIDELGVVSFSSTETLVSDVRAWLDDSADNFGWLLLGGEGITGSARRFHSRESNSVENRPTLFLEFSLGDLLPGDVNGDGSIDLNDFSILKNNFGASGAARARRAT